MLTFFVTFQLLLLQYTQVLTVTPLGSSHSWSDSPICNVSDWKFEDSIYSNWTVNGPKLASGYETCLYGPWGIENKWVQRTFSTSLLGFITMNIRIRLFTGCSPDDDEFCYVRVDYHDSLGTHRLFNDSRTGSPEQCNGYYSDWIAWGNKTTWPRCTQESWLKLLCYKELSLFTDPFDSGQISIRFGCPLSGHYKREHWAIANFYLDIITENPTETPTQNPSFYTSNPSYSPSKFPSVDPTDIPSNNPSENPSNIPSNYPSIGPSKYPSKYPSLIPSETPSNYPSKSPSFNPSNYPSRFPTVTPSITPSNFPSKYPSNVPSNSPSDNPSNTPSKFPTMIPSTTPTNYPSQYPSNEPSNSPTQIPSSVTNAPSINPTVFPISSDSKTTKGNNINDELILYLILPSSIVCIILLCVIIYLCHKTKHGKAELDENVSRIKSNSEVQIELHKNSNKIVIPTKILSNINNNSNKNNYSNGLFLQTVKGTNTTKLQNGEKSRLNIKKDSFSTSSDNNTEFQVEGLYKSKSKMTLDTNDGNVMTPNSLTNANIFDDINEEEDSLFGKKGSVNPITQNMQDDSGNTKS